jgi:hypothetical protein
MSPSTLPQQILATMLMTTQLHHYHSHVFFMLGIVFAFIGCCEHGRALCVKEPCSVDFHCIHHAFCFVAVATVSLARQPVFRMFGSWLLLRRNF